MASWLVRSTPDRAVRVRDLGGDIVLCSWARHLSLTVPLSTQANLMPLETESTAKESSSPVIAVVTLANQISCTILTGNVIF